MAVPKRFLLILSSSVSEIFVGGGGGPSVSNHYEKRTQKRWHNLDNFIVKFVHGHAVYLAVKTESLPVSLWFKMFLKKLPLENNFQF